MMISDKERRILAEVEQHLRREDPGLVRRFEAATQGGPGRRGWMTWVTSVQGIIVWVVLMIASVLLGLSATAILFFVLAVFGGFARPLSHGRPVRSRDPSA
jgi:hypothetical protein